MKIKTNLLLFVLCIFLLLVKIAFAAEEEKSKAKDDAKLKGRPPSLVEVAQIISGEAEPMVEFVGTVYYADRKSVV